MLRNFSLLCFGFDMHGFCSQLFRFRVAFHVPQFDRIFFLNRMYGRWSLFTLVFLIDMEIALLRPCGDSALAGRTVHQLPKETTINPLHSIVLCFEDRAHSFVDFFYGTAPSKVCT